MRPLLVGCHLSALFWIVLSAPAVGARDLDDESDNGRAPVASPFTPSLLSPGRAAPLVYVGAEAGWDGPRREGVFETNAEASVFGPLSFRAGAASNPADRRVTPSFLLKLDVLDQGHAGVDVALFGGYRGEGFNLVPAIEIGAVLCRRSDRLSLISSLAYGQGLERGERYGDVRLAGLVRLHRLVNVGLDARARFDLELDNDEPSGEATVDGIAGPLVVVGLGRFILSGQSGAGVLAARAGGPAHVGATTRIGLGATF